MAATPASKVSNKAVLTEYFETHGADVKAWPKGWKQAIAERTGGSVNAIGVTRCKMAKTWPTQATKPTDRPHLEVVPDPEPDPPTPAPATTDPEPKQAMLPDADREWLSSRGITGEQQEAVTRITRREDLPPGFDCWGPKAVPCLCFRWRSIDGRESFQLRPDTPIEASDGEVHKYLFAKGHKNVLAVPPGHQSLVLDPGIDLLICEGTKQHLAAASALAGERVAVVGTAGCWGHRVSRDNQSSALVPCFQKIPLEGRRVWLLLDADRATNRRVYDAAQDQHDSLVMLFGASHVRFVKVPGSGTADLDDLLSQYPSQGERKKVLRRLLDNALEKQGREPSKKTAKARPFIDEETGKLAVADLYEAMLNRHPMGVYNIGENKASLLVYRNGMFHNGKEREFENSVTMLLGNGFEPRHLSNVREFAISRLVQRGGRLSARQTELKINFRNGVLDVMTLELERHDPSQHTFLNQVPYDWKPEAECPYYEAWINERIPGQVEIYEDSVSQVLDWRKETMKAPFLFGKESTGKTTALYFPRLLIGEKNMAKLSLQELGHNDFAAAELSGKLLNICGDLERDEVRSLATFKQLTGGDGKTANKKFGDFVDLDWIGTFMFSANQIPSVSGDPGSYLKRIQPIWFKRTYSGAENPEIGNRLRERSEVEGVIVRFVKALQQHQLRGGYLKPDPAAAEHFGSRSDQVRRFLVACTYEVPHRDGKTKDEILMAFERWARDNNCGMGRNTFYGRLDALGIRAKKVKDLPGRRFPLALRDEEDWDSYDDADDPDNGDSVSDRGEKGRFPVLVPAFSEGSGGSDRLAEQAVPTIPGNKGKGAVAYGRSGEGSVANGKGKAPTTEKLGGVENREYREPPVLAVGFEGETPEKNREPKVGTGDLVLIPDPPSDDLIQAGSADPLVVDLETRSASELWTTPNGSGPFIRLVGTDHGNNIDPSQLLEHAGPLVAHNGFGFDFLALAHHHGLPLLELTEAGLLVDTMVLALALDPPADGGMSGGQLRRHYSLDNCATRAGIEGKTDDLGKLARSAAKAAGHTGKPSELQALGYGLIPQGDPEYNAYLRGDITAGRGVFEALVPTGQLDDYSRREMKIMGRLTAGITLAGTRLDLELTQKRFDQIERAKDACRQILVEKFNLPTTTATGRPAKNPLNCTGAAEAITAAAKVLGLDLPTTAKTGKPSTSKDNLGPLLEQAKQAGNERQIAFLETVLGLTGARSVYGTALDYVQADGRIHPTVAPLQASGRFSITQPGITVFGKRGGKVIERAIFLPDSDDHVLIAADLSQVDMRAIAAHAQDPAYIELFAPGRDAHSEVASAVGLTRSDAKAIGHGWNYGMSVKGMVRHGIEEAKAVQFDRGMRRSFPTLCRWRDRVRDQAERGHKLDNGFGRLMKANPDRAYTQAPALMGQGTARDLMMEAVLRLPLWLVPQLRFLVHDELVFSVPADQWESAGQEILQAMTFDWCPPGGSLSVKVTGDLSKPGRNWAECYAD